MQVFNSSTYSVQSREDGKIRISQRDPTDQVQHIVEIFPEEVEQFIRWVQMAAHPMKKQPT